MPASGDWADFPVAPSNVRFGVKRTCRLQQEMAACDPKRTATVHEAAICCLQTALFNQSCALYTSRRCRPLKREQVVDGLPDRKLNLRLEVLSMRYVVNLLAGFVLAGIVVSFALAQPVEMSRARAAAIRECNVLAAPYVQYTWGDWQLYIYRACMARHGQTE